ncbi:hypothetical protein HDU93_005324 [Gonapodya sp. JEL0774]|nr:hypothetical protein HDU93_005324 [Gonapodya sp. JEL0774]
MDLDTSVPMYGDVSRPELPDEAVSHKSETRFVSHPSSVWTIVGVGKGDAVPEASAPGAFSAHSFAEAHYWESWAKAQYADYDLHSVFNVLQNRILDWEADSLQYIEAAQIARDIPDTMHVPDASVLLEPPVIELVEPAPTPTAVDVLGMPVYEVEVLLDCRQNGPLVEYYVKFNGYSVPEWVEEENILEKAMLDDYESRYRIGPHGRALTRGQRKRAMNTRLEIHRAAYFGRVGTEDPPPQFTRPPEQPRGMKPSGSDLMKGLRGSLQKRKGEKVAQGAMAVDDELETAECLRVMC